MKNTHHHVLEDHVARINIVLSFIDDHLEEELSLEKVASIASYSPFHFHRIFRALMNETLNTYIVRKRIEKAASILIRKPSISITALSLQYGFNGNAAFTRSFKKYYGMSPSEFRSSAPGKYSKISKADRKNGQGKVSFEKYLWGMKDQLQWMDAHARVEIREMPALKLAYISHVGDKGQEQTFGKLMDWASEEGLMRSPDVQFLKIYHDSFKITAPDQVRMSMCMVLHSAVRTAGAVGITEIAKGRFAVARMELGMADFEKAWTSMFMWINHNGYKTTERNCFEIYHNDPSTHPEHKFIIDLCVPVDGTR